ncbi:MAG: glycosyltransferase family 4 protein [Lachnospiraceae bacterium]|nr:glycosyltransferase family 4 protein [Lachnospiraceae bacterium]
MKILILSHEYPPIGGGGANACFFLAREFARMGNYVAIVTAQFENLPQKEATADGVLIYRVKCKRKAMEKSSFPEMLSYLISALVFSDNLQKTEHFDKCIAFFGIPSGPIALHLKRRYKLPYAVRLGGGDIPGAQKRFKYIYMVLAPVIRRIWREADALIANSEGLKERALEFESKYPITVIENGVDSQFFTPASKKNQIGTGIKILFVSRLIEGKGLQYLIPHLRQIEFAVRKKCSQSITLIIVGDGPYKTALKNLAHETGTQHLVYFAGRKNKDEVRQYYQEADIFVLPSLSEGMPNVVLEAMACGLPIVMTPCEGSKELVTDNGFITSIGNLSDNLVKLCVDSSLRTVMGQNSVQNVKQCFEWENTAKRYLKILKTE